MTSNNIPVSAKVLASSLIVASLALVFGMMGVNNAQAAVLVDEDTVRVESGDTLSGIAQRFLGNSARWPEIQDLNNIENPNLIFPGQLINLPEGEIVDPVPPPTPRPITRTETIFVQPQQPVQQDNLGGLFQLLILSRLFDDSEGDRSDRLFDLLIIDQLFQGQTFSGTTTGTDSSGLFQLIILDRLFDRE